MILIDAAAPKPRQELQRFTGSRFLPKSIRDEVYRADREHLKSGGSRRCKWCAGPVVKPRLTFCSDDCVHEWKLRVSGSYVRFHVYKRDRGVCACCRIDTDRMARLLQPTSYWRELLREFCDRHGIRDPHRMAEEEEAAWDRRRKRILFKADRIKKKIDRTWLLANMDLRSFWDADHVVRVVDGGGCCGLDNYQTLCVFCHAKKTREGNSKPPPAPKRKQTRRRRGRRIVDLYKRRY